MGAYMGFGVWDFTCCLRFLHDGSFGRDFLRDSPLNDVCIAFAYAYSSIYVLFQNQGISNRCHFGTINAAIQDSTISLLR